MADRKMRILVVDDANLVRLYYRQILEEAGFEVEEALNGLEALERLLASPPDAVIVDINMPLMDGLTFLSALRRQACRCPQFRRLSPAPSCRPPTWTRRAPPAPISTLSSRLARGSCATMAMFCGVPQ